MKRQIHFIFAILYFYHALTCDAMQLRSGFETNWVDEYRYKRPILGPILKQDEESTDGYILVTSFSELQDKIKHELPGMYFEKFDSDEFQLKPYLKIKNPRDINTIFFALRKLYPYHIACDTVTILVGYYQTNRAIDLKILHDFIIARSYVFDLNPIPIGHPYHTHLSELNHRIGTPILNENNLKLDQILKQNGDLAIIATQTHAGVIKRRTEGDYVASAWNPEAGVFFITLSYKSNEKFEHNTWGNMDIKEYIKLSKHEETSTDICLRSDAHQDFFTFEGEKSIWATWRGRFN